MPVSIYQLYEYNYLPKYWTISKTLTSDNVQLSDDEEVSSALAWNKQKELTLEFADRSQRAKVFLPHEESATFDIRVRYQYKVTVAKSDYRIYKNGVGYGTNRENDPADWTWQYEDLSFTLGDLVQLYTNANGGATCYVRNFRIYFDFDRIEYDTEPVLT